MELTQTIPTAAEVAAIVRERAQVEWREWDAIARHVDAGEARVRACDSHSLLRDVELGFVSADVAHELHWSEGQVNHRVAQARRVRDHTPRVWAAFRDGLVDGSKVREISSAVENLQRAGSIARLDKQVVAYAERHTLAELRRWLKVFIARVEADLFNERAERELEDRGVDIAHGDNGMSTLVASHASPLFAAIDKRLTKEAKALGADDPRTLQQRRADLLAAWLTTNDAGEAAVNAQLAATMPGHAVAGSEEAPAVAADGSWVAPAQWMLDLAKHDRNNIFWHRMILDPITDDVLAHEYRGRFAPAVLRQALEFRDGVCQAPGCCKPASLCDIDHRVPYEVGGPTSASNTGPLCEKDHKRKGFALLAITAPSHAPPGRSLNTPLWSVGTPGVSVEFRIHRFLKDHANRVQPR